MNSWLVGGLLSLSCLIPTTDTGALGGAAPAKEPVWLADYAAARKIAQDEGKPLLVVFRCVP